MKAIIKLDVPEFQIGQEVSIYFKDTMMIRGIVQEPSGDLISRDELLKAIDTWDKFGCDANTKLVPYQDHYIPYIHYDDVIKCIKGMPSVNPIYYPPCIDCNKKMNEIRSAYDKLKDQKNGYISIDDVMSVFDDFMCDEVDEEGTEIFLEMLKDKAGSEEYEV